MKLKIFTFLIIAIFGAASQAQEIEWMSMNEALDAQKENPKSIFMDAYTSWCGPCKMLDSNTFSNKDLAQYVNKHFYAVKFNAEGPEEIEYKDRVFKNPKYDAERSGRNSTHEFASAMRISGYPTMVFFDQKGEMIAPVVGYRTPEQLEIFLKLFAGDEYKKFTSQEDFTEYRENFKGEFTN
ncbi:thioredoxin fold domain-containing protein [Zunongwangia sp. F260]|uniref:Thioredoxin fold domain-containing protein n=1 Tax=Autumnicola lenta TaxID=3075593 RepID=A0ABU3CHE7_9FLAO|nr:thioredoxin fold domain-containing protein [Zunongwangia sp. F260]MDT0645765.1 thioredoxin fold domain-containing protein [Zunongwangia sp. F260]